MGKSTLCKAMSEKYCNGYFVNEETENPYLEKFYAYMSEHPNQYNPFSIKSQMYFLQRRIQNEREGQKLIWEADSRKENIRPSNK